MSYTISGVDLPEQQTAVVRAHVAHHGIGEFLGSAFGEVMSAASGQGLHVAGPPFGRYRPAEDGGWDIEAGFPVNGPLTAAGRVEPSTLPGGHAAHTLHTGAYDAVAGAYQALEGWILENSSEPTGEPWECYLDGPEVAEPRTEVFWPCHPAHR